MQPAPQAPPSSSARLPHLARALKQMHLHHKLENNIVYFFKLENNTVYFLWVRRVHFTLMRSSVMDCSLGK